MELAGIKKNVIERFMWAPWHKDNILKCTKYLDHELGPAVKEFADHLTEMNVEEWRLLPAGDPMIQKLHRLQTTIKHTWKLRPQFIESRGRALREGY